MCLEFLKKKELRSKKIRKSQITKRTIIGKENINIHKRMSLQKKPMKKQNGIIKKRELFKSGSQRRRIGGRGKIY